MTRHIDWGFLIDEFEGALTRRMCTLRGAAGEMGVPAANLSKFRNKQGVLSADTLAGLVAWLWPRSIPEWIITHDKDEGP